VPTPCSARALFVILLQAFPGPPVLAQATSANRMTGTARDQMKFVQASARREPPYVAVFVVQ
jgi:hypothetical protein